jgi:hypothetical protein
MGQVWTRILKPVRRREDHRVTLDDFDAQLTSCPVCSAIVLIEEKELARHVVWHDERGEWPGNDGVWLPPKTPDA